MTTRLLEMVRRPCCEHFLDYFPFTELQCMVPLSMFAHYIPYILLTFQKNKKALPTKPLTWQMKMKVPLIFIFDCRNMADICATVQENSSTHFSDVTSRKMTQINDIWAAWERNNSFLEEEDFCSIFTCNLVYANKESRNSVLPKGSTRVSKFFDFVHLTQQAH